MADLRRFFVESISDLITIEGEEYRHAVSVLRIKEGEKIIACDNTGFEFICEILEISKKYFTAKVLEKVESETEALNKVCLIAGYLKGDKTELVVQKAVELGVKEIVVFSSKFSSAFMNENKLSRLNKVSIEASKQCGRAVAPKVIYKESLESALEFGNGYENKLFACEFATKNDIDISSLTGSTCIVVGSEGGFSKEEYSNALDLGYKTLYLGKRILRAETACIALTGIVMNSLGELK